MRNVLYIYSKYLNKKKKYYFFKYRSKVVKSLNLKICTCQYSTYENDFEQPLYTIYPNNNTNRNYNFSTSTEYLKLNNKISNVKIQDFIINKENSNIYSNFINLNKSEYFYNGNEIGSFSSFNINNQNPTKNIISVKNGINNKKYVVKIKLYGNQIKPEEIESHSIKYKQYTNNNKKFVKNIYSYKNNKSKKFKGLLTERSYQKDHNQNIKGKSIDINKYMNDQEILDYLNTNNIEKKNLIKKILNQKLENQPKVLNKKKIQLNNSKSYSYINNNYNYNNFSERQSSPTPYNTNNINNYRGNTRYNYSYRYFDNENQNINKETYNQKNTKIIFSKKQSLRPCCSNEAIFYRNYNGKNKEENNRNNINYFSSNYNNKKSFKKQNIETSPNISPFDNKIKNVYSPSTRIIILNQKNKLKKSESTNKIIKRSKQFYQNQNTLTIKSTNIINKKKETSEKEKEKKPKKTKIPIASTHHMKSISLDANSNNNKIDEKKKNKNNKKYLINNVVNEQFNNAIIKYNKKEGTTTTNSENENLEISVQSMNDSKMMELAKNYVKQEDNLNRNEITQILNCKKGWI